jgi:hypothetical protein
VDGERVEAERLFTLHVRSVIPIRRPGPLALARVGLDP